MWPEFITGTAEQRNSLQSRNNRFVQWGWPEQIPVIQTADGVAISIDTPEYIVERWFYYMNWLYSDEGMTFSSFGLKGIHFEWVDDERPLER